jgi:hypothetical protein
MDLRKVIIVYWFVVESIIPGVNLDRQTIAAKLLNPSDNTTIQVL